jgi:hypothetical protein
VPVQGLLALALALPTGALFGIGYGTGVRIGYEQIYPALFPKQLPKNATSKEILTDTIKGLNSVYDTVGGKDASFMGMGAGVANAMDDIRKNLTSEDLKALGLNESGHMQSNLTKRKASAVTEQSTSRDSYSNTVDYYRNTFDIDTNTGRYINVFPKLSDDEVASAYKEVMAGTHVFSKNPQFKSLLQAIKDEYYNRKLHLSAKYARNNLPHNIPKHQLQIVFANGQRTNQKISDSTLEAYKRIGYTVMDKKLVHPSQHRNIQKETLNNNRVQAHGSAKQKQSELNSYIEYVRQQIAKKFRGQPSSVARSVMAQLVKGEYPHGRIHPSDLKEYNIYISKIKRLRN